MEVSSRRDETQAKYLLEEKVKILCHIQLFQLTLSDQSIKLEDKTARLCGIFF